MTRADPAAARPPHPFIYLVLILPFGICSGFVVVTLAYQLSSEASTRRKSRRRRRGPVSPDLEVLWAPFADTTLNEKPGMRSAPH